jgi:hypothetical protein
MMTRRFFIGGAASCFALGAGRIFAAKSPLAAAGKALLTFGVVSDVHIAMERGGKKLNKTYTTETFRDTLTRFRDAGVDAVVIAGDMAHFGVGPELLALGRVWDEIFPGNRAPDGRLVEKVFVTGNHDNGKNRAKKIFTDPKVLAENTFSLDPKKWWDLAFHEEWQPIYAKSVKGYSFVGVNWVIGDCRGAEEKFNLAIPDWYAKNGAALDPSRPFFHVQHPHPKGTVHGPTVWGQDNGLSTKALMNYSNAISFSGHSHTSLTDERSIWQGGFTSVGCGTLRNVSLAVPGVGAAPTGHENYKTSDKLPPEVDAQKAMAMTGRFGCRQEQVVRVFGDHVRFSRTESITGQSYGDDLVMPLPAAEKKPFDYKMREAKAMAPEFPAGATLKVSRVKGHLRGTKAKRKEKVDVWEVVIPRPDAVRNVRPATYDLSFVTPDGQKLAVSVLDEGHRFPAESAKGKACAVCRVACSRVPSDHFTVQVRAASCWGRRSAPLELKV